MFGSASLLKLCLSSPASHCWRLFIFGMVKGKFTGASPLKSWVQPILVRGLAVGAAYGLAKLIS
jgi:VIT1/CCC1 family predicted Fe2+/Mn2+ transporter